MVYTEKVTLNIRRETVRLLYNGTQCNVNYISTKLFP